MAPAWTPEEERQKLEGALEKAKKCMQELKQNVLEDTSFRTMSATSRKNFEKLELLFRELSADESRRKVGDLLSDMDAATVFVRYIKILREDLSLFKYNEECSAVMRRVFRKYTDASDKLRVECGKAGVLEELTSDLKSNHDHIESNQVPQVVTASLAILHNCARNDDNLPYFVDAGTVDVLKLYFEQSKSEFIKMVATLTLSYIMNESEKQSVGQSVIGIILKYLKNAVESKTHRYERCSAAELVDGLLHLAGNDDNKILMLESDLHVLDILADLIENGNAEEQRLSVETAWALAFADKISSNSKIISLLKKIEKSTSSSRRLRESAAGTLWCLNEEIYLRNEAPSKTIQENPTGDEDKAVQDYNDKKHIMISYNHKSGKAIAQKIYNRLSKLEYRLWIDEKDIDISIYDSMAKAVENSACFIMCMSRGYKDSPYCQLEAKYAKKKSVPLLPIRVEKNYEPEGWLGLFEGGLIYSDFCDDLEFEEEFQKLVKRIDKLIGKRNAS